MRLVPTVLATTLLALAGCGGEETGSSTRATNPKAVDRLNSLARGELAAVETYRQAISKDGSASDALTELRRGHEDAASRLSSRVRTLGGTPPTDSGAWGDFARSVEGAAKVFGNDMALRALRSGEEQGTRSYESALAASDLDADSKTLVRDTLLPRQRGLAASVQRLIDAPTPTTTVTTGSVPR